MPVEGTRSSPGGDVTQILEAVGAGREGANDRLLTVVYEELRKMARGLMAGEKPGQTLQPTALVHEAYLRLLGDRTQRWENRRHFFATAAEAMRRILIEEARHKARLKRGGDRERITLGDDAALTRPKAEELLAVDEALQRLERRDPDMAAVVKLRYFGGLTLEETARTLDKSERAVSRRWTAARVWMKKELSDSGGC
ncbi:MAG: sigma-70 family RNA polymerase sigma factor [Thermoanaerobaculia bacterium]|nr:sigma-70 family RNA polymerase sigma factor [Thermoanaerobaculia bacterium]